VIFLPGFGLAQQTLLPKPTGPYAVGRTSFYLVNESVRDEDGSRPDRKREFMVLVWYPAAANSKAPPSAWLPFDWAKLETDGFLGMLLKRSSDPAASNIPKVLNSVGVYAHEDSPLADSPNLFPVIVFSPGNLMFPTYYSSLVEDLASHGYVVIGHVPTGYVNAVSFPDGHVNRRAAKPDFSLWIGDLKYILDQVAFWDGQHGNRFYKRLDLDRVGAFGHSGGANAVSVVAHSDHRIKAGFFLDPGLLRVEDASGPAFIQFNAENADYKSRHPDEALAIGRERQDFARASKPGIQVTLSGSDHNSFTDLAVIKAFQRTGDGNAFLDTTRAFLREFFDEYLLGKRSDLIHKGSPKYPLAKVEVVN
jgi:hypothetical protein